MSDFTNRLLAELDELMGRYPGPDMPKFEKFDISPEQEASILDEIERRIGRTTRQGLKDVRHGYAGRGMYRSGTRRRAERKVIRTGQEATASGFAQYMTGKANRMANLTGQRAQFELNRFQILRRQFEAEQTARGQIVASEFAGRR